MKLEFGKISWKYKIAIIILLVIGFFGVKQIFSPRLIHEHTSQEKVAVKYWTCSMHPQIKLPTQGKCPICAMDLIPVKETLDQYKSEQSAVLVLSEDQRSRAKVSTQIVERKFVEASIHVSGKVTYDETRLSYITAWINGRIDKLFVDYTGITVNKGDHMVYLYSPELLSAQQEYLETLAGDTVSKSNAQEKLKLMGITHKQIKAIEKRGTPINHMIIYAPVGGIVISKHVKEGTYVKTGTKIYTIADLESVWIILDAYESDARFIQYGQKVIFETESLPGEKFIGTVSFVHPVMDELSRTFKVRLNISNKKKLLKPGMFVRANIQVLIGETGPITKEKYDNKWICPMHLEVLRNNPANCPICGMKLKKASSVLDGISYMDEQSPPLVIPASAPLITGKRAVVYVETDKSDTQSVYEGREVILGARAGDYYIVKAGLSEGEQVVVKGNFKIDSALQIEAKPSMMSPEEKKSDKISHEYHQKKLENILQKESRPKDKDYSHSILKTFNSTYKIYFNIQEALSNDNYKNAISFVKILNKEIQNIKLDNLDIKIKSIAVQIKNIIKHVDHVRDIASLRSMIFGKLSTKIIELEEMIGHTGKSIHYKMFCPMTNNRQGGFWLQNNDKLKNPYYGKSMLLCGETKDIYYPKK
ncbi:efflux RND transporter periplasmic adaptor subunit [bacterium]